MDEIFFKMGDLLRSLHFSSIICTCWRDKMKSCSFILHKFVMHVTNKQFLDKFDNGCKKIQNGRFTVIFCILLQQFDLVGAITSKFTNGGGLLSSVL